MQVMPSVPSIAKGVSINLKMHTWKGVLRLILCVVEHDVVPGRINQPVILQQVDVLFDLTINTEDKSIEKLLDTVGCYLGVTVIPFKLEPVMLLIFIYYLYMKFYFSLNNSLIID